LNPIVQFNTIVLFIEGSMSVEQTDQLIRLILNSILIVIACAIVFNSFLMRHAAILNRMRAVQQDYVDLLRTTETHLRHLRHSYRMAHASVLLAQAALLFCVASTVVIAFRTFIPANWLIQMALLLFIGGVALLLVSVAVMLHDIRTANTSLWEELNWTLSLSSNSAKPGSALSRSRVPRSGRRRASL
jgi:hypothetical protein